MAAREPLRTTPVCPLRAFGPMPAAAKRGHAGRRRRIGKRKEQYGMMEGLFLMIGTLLVSFGLVRLLVKWCQKQVESQE